MSVGGVVEYMSDSWYWSCFTCCLGQHNTFFFPVGRFSKILNILCHELFCFLQKLLSIQNFKAEFQALS